MRVTAPVRARLFAEGESPRLLGSRCRACGSHHFPAHESCPYCASEEVGPVELSDKGRLWAWTAVTAAPPGYRGAIPYGFGVVELPEGIRVITRLTEADTSRLHAGQPMQLTIVDLYTDGADGVVVSYAFAPQSAQAAP